MKMATLILLHSHYDAAHLELVKVYMAEHGAPTLHAVDMGEGIYYLLEGCHRARAAAELGVAINLELVDYDYERDDELTINEFFGGSDLPAEDCRLVKDVVGAHHSNDQEIDCDVEIA
jgi:hypothetical protein